MATVLIVDDSVRLQQHVSHTLLESGVAERVLTADNGARALQLLSTEKIDLVLCDLIMPGIDGFKVLRLIRERDEAVQIPVILLTAKGEVSEKVRCLDAGGSDYLTKPFDNQELVARCRVHLQLKLRTEQLQRLATTDYLTGAANRLQLKENLTRELNRAGRSGGAVGFLILDLDHFKDINDGWGHLVGDEVLVAVAKALSSELRSCDLVARYGGEEFAAILPDAGIDGVRRAAERCRRRIEKIVFPDSKNQLKISASFGGVSVGQPKYAQVETVISAADSALYEAKERGRNRVVMSEDFTEQSGKAAPSRLLPKRSERRGRDSTERTDRVSGG